VELKYAAKTAALYWSPSFFRGKFSLLSLWPGILTRFVVLVRLYNRRQHLTHSRKIILVNVLTDIINESIIQVVYGTWCKVKVTAILARIHIYTTIRLFRIHGILFRRLVEL